MLMAFVFGAISENHSRLNLSNIAYRCTNTTTSTVMQKIENAKLSHSARDYKRINFNSLHKIKKYERPPLHIFHNYSFPMKKFTYFQEIDRCLVWHTQSTLYTYRFSSQMLKCCSSLSLSLPCTRCPSRWTLS